MAETCTVHCYRRELASLCARLADFPFGVITLPADQLAALPVDQLGLMILGDLVATDAWHEYNYVVDARHRYGGEALETIAGGFHYGNNVVMPASPYAVNVQINDQQAAAFTVAF